MTLLHKEVANHHVGTPHRSANEIQDEMTIGDNVL